MTRPAEHVRVIICGSDRCAEVCATRASRSFRYEETQAQGTSLHSAVETVHGAGCRVQGCRFVRLFVCSSLSIESLVIELISGMSARQRVSACA